MAATVASLPAPPVNDTPAVNPAEARKRRREILASQRNTSATPDASASAVLVVAESPETKKRKVITSADLPAVVSPTSPAKKTADGKPKKPQMKYDPEVPMTKEEAAAWRREQRRKRNRESAAASRQRQRDRIVELEAEVEEWKVKFDEAMKRIRELEQTQANPASTVVGDSSVPEETIPEDQDVSMEDDDGITIQSPEELVEEVFKDTTILISPSNSPRSVSPTGSATVDFSQVQAIKVVSSVGASSVLSKEDEAEEQEEPPKMISRQAVKINSGSTSTLPLLPDDESLLCPEPCTSTANKIAPIDPKLFPRPVEEDTAPVPVNTMLTVAAENEEEFGEFLLDAVDWL